VTRIVVVGVGALGSHLLLLGRNLPATWVLVDFDRVEQKNTLSQFHSRMGLRKNKAQALQQSLQGLFGLRVEALPRRLSVDNVDAILGGADLVVDCVDNAETRLLIQDYVRAHNVPCLHGALAADGQYARIMWDDLFAIDRGGEGAATCEGGEHLPFIAIVSAQMAAIVQVFLKDGVRLNRHLYPGGMTNL
jgi:molybdopterin-synthase adenylyltransferase